MPSQNVTRTVSRPSPRPRPDTRRQNSTPSSSRSGAPAPEDHRPPRGSGQVQGVRLPVPRGLLGDHVVDEHAVVVVGEVPRAVGGKKDVHAVHPRVIHGSRVGMTSRRYSYVHGSSGPSPTGCSSGIATRCLARRERPRHVVQAGQRLPPAETHSRCRGDVTHLGDRGTSISVRSAAPISGGDREPPIVARLVEKQAVVALAGFGQAEALKDAERTLIGLQRLSPDLLQTQAVKAVLKTSRNSAAPQSPTPGVPVADYESQFATVRLIAVKIDVPDKGASADRAQPDQFRGRRLDETLMERWSSVKGRPTVQPASRQNSASAAHPASTPASSTCKGRRATELSDLATSRECRRPPRTQPSDCGSRADPKDAHGRQAAR